MDGMDAMPVAVLVVAGAALGLALYIAASQPELTHPSLQRHTEEAQFGGFQINMKAYMDNQRLVTDPKYKYRPAASWIGNTFETRGELNATARKINPNNGVDGELQIYGSLQRFGIYGSPSPAF